MGIIKIQMIKIFLLFPGNRTGSRPPSDIFAVIMLVLLFLLPWFPTQAQQLPKLSEYKLKAAFLYKFALFVDWPVEAFADSSSPYVLGLLGTDPFGKNIDEILKDKKIKGKSIIIKRYDNYTQINDCHILFISYSEYRKLKLIFKHLRTAPILTVSEADGFARKGGIINFIHGNNKIRFEINHAKALAHKLNISSKLLRLARIIE